jgi:membrane-bound lytic murein transglycosylase D
VTKLSGRKAEEFRFSLSRELYSLNGVPFIYSSGGETYQSIAASNHLFHKELLKFNDLKEDEPLKPGTVVYLQKKKRQAAKGLDMHVLEKGETLRGIAQRYGVRLGALRKLNDISDENLLREGDKIRLRK